MDTSRPPVTTELTRALAEHARLPLAEERIAGAAHVLQGVQGLIDQLYEVELGDTALAATFDPRWT
ncbi:MAG: hypothetical protein M3Y49_00995 [Actinomycetota bacterium]|nr:hypothetical protein [Actinomycetota bacterium]